LLTAQGHDVSTVAMQGMGGRTDVALYEACRIEGRVLITLNRDFGEVLRFPPEHSAGIAVIDCRGRHSPSTILARIKRACLGAGDSVDQRATLDRRARSGLSP
jgi:hypothetical protein